MLPQNAAKPPIPATCSKTHTSMKILNFEHYWTIEQFSRCHLGNSNYLESTPFFYPGNETYKFQLRIYPTGFSERVNGHVSLYLILHTEETKPLNVSFKFSVIDRDGKKSFTVGREEAFSEKKNGFGYCRFVPRAKVVRPFLMDRLFPIVVQGVPFDQLVIHCEVTYATNLVTTGTTGTF